MKKIINFILVLVIMSIASEAFNISSSEMIVYIQSPTNNPTNTNFGENISFKGYVEQGTVPYSHAWIFCNTCNPKMSTLQITEAVAFNDPGTYNISYTVVDNDGKSGTDNIIINVNLAKIVYPNNNTFWGVNEAIPFQGQGLYADNTIIFTYWWDFGDTTTNNNFAAQRTNKDPVGIKYYSTGQYNVSFTVTHQPTLKQETKQLSVNIVEPININFTCTLKHTSCSASEIELLRLFEPINSHTRTIDDANKNWYTYPLCCATPSLVVQKTEDKNSPAIYLTTTNDLDSQLGGSHLGGSSSMYELTSFQGAGPQCQTTFLGLNGKCSDYKLKCIYEFYPGPDSITQNENSHLSNCTTSIQPNNFGNETWAMCCEIPEDCTNNLDDNENMWFDCNDETICTIKNNERACGTSDQLLQNSTCNWMQTECTEEGCDFSTYSKPYWDDFFNTWGFELSELNINCTAYFMDNAWKFSDDCPAGTNESNIKIPQSAINAVGGINAIYAPLNTFAEEVYFKCRYYYCSVGEDKNKPLPAFVNNMNTNGAEARHCCPLGTYWDPELINDFNNNGKCTLFEQCYDKYDTATPSMYPCKSDFLTNFTSWILDINGSTNPDHQPEDCIRDDLINIGITEKTLCCPVWINNENTYGMTDIIYYKVP